MKIAIASAGILSAIGNNHQEVCTSLLNRQTGIGKTQYLRTRHTDLPVGEVKLSNDQMKAQLGLDPSQPVSRTTLMGALAVRQAVDESGLTLSGKRVVLICGTTVGGMDLTEEYYSQLLTGEREIGLLQYHDCGNSTDHIARILGIECETCTISTACSSSLNSIILGAEMLRSNEADIIIAGGSESLSRFHLNGFNTLMILDREQCRPFDATRAGLNLGEGAGFVVLVREQQCVHKPLGWIGGYCNSCDAFHQTASSDDGQGAYIAMNGALQMAGLKPSDIDYVNAHGTGTPNNDPSESTALRRIFGESLPPVSSTKSFTGHTTSASGSIESIICLIAMQHRFIPASLGFSQRDPDCIMPATGTQGVTLDNVLCNSFGFGGNDSSLVISSRPVELHSTEKQFDCCIVADEVIDNAEQLKDYKDVISPLEARRMGKLQKASTMTAMRALSRAGVKCPDAIITATKYGMLDTSIQFLDDMENNGESLLKPTLFMQSTHNTLGSAIAIRLKCHGYNTTYTQGDNSAG
nr:beta-ketoacyl-[acyl-carrier-protein] synthase family protein [Bacteroidaceae bacterium]